MERVKYPFEYDGKSYVVWAWKGDYPSWGAGTEVGFYTQDVPLIEAGEIWHADPTVELPDMSVALTDLGGGAKNWKGGEAIASFSPEKPQVWTGTWNTNKQNVPLRDMTSLVTINFQSPGMAAAFRNSSGIDVNVSFSNNGMTATIRFRRRKEVR
jgi:hypothetical protein